MSNHETMTQGFSILREYLAPFILRELQKIPEYQIDDMWWIAGVVNQLDERARVGLHMGVDFGSRADSMDIAACLNLIERHWHGLFRQHLPRSVRTWAREVQDFRNLWAHPGANDFSDSDAWRALDTMARLCGAIAPGEEGEADINQLIRDARYDPARNPVAEDAPPADRPQGVLQTAPVQGLPGWRGVMKPHPDVAQGLYKKAEFAADLAQVTSGEGAIEYRDPVEFFSRTYVTAGMKGLLVQALRRVSGKDGEPVIQLKTAFGGGKTHSMLALYHLLRGRAPAVRIPNIKGVLEAAELTRLPICRVAVIVGTSLNPAKSKRPLNMPGVTINTLWGEIAAQLALDAGDPRLYDFVKEADKKGVAPGSEALRQLFDACGPCVILIDELVAYAKKLFGASNLPAGTFDNFITFIQELTEAARASQNSLVVASIPESKIEVGEEGGLRALEAIEHTFGRMESIWKPVAADEGFEIVRRRLFLPCENEEARDQVCLAFSRMYQENSADFPAQAKEVSYYERLRSCYPIHPEVFDRLYEDWATIEHFQKTRGVLRLMAAVIHHLWICMDGGLLIMPGSIPLDTASVRDELTTHVGENWNAIVDREVDSKASIPFQKDREISRFGGVMAARRVARTIMLGSAPSERSQSVRGIEASRIRLGVVQPGENIATFNDALTTLATSLSYLYSNSSGDRFWYDTRPTLRKTVEDRASQRTLSEVDEEIERRLRGLRKEAPIGRIHVCPDTSLDVSDEQDVGLVILPTAYTYRGHALENLAVQYAENLLNERGVMPRTYRNTLAFIAPDRGSLSSLQEEARRYLAWQSIRNDTEALNLDTAQIRETDRNIASCDNTVNTRVRETYCWLLVPYIDREVDLRTINWEAVSIRGGDDSIVVKAARKMQQSDQLITQWAPTLLKMLLDKLLWQGRDEIAISDLWKMLCTYCYLPRLASFGVLEQTIRAGVHDKGIFAYADGMSDGKYVGLKAEQFVGVIDRQGVIVSWEAAQRQLEAEAIERGGGGNGGGGGGRGEEGGGHGEGGRHGEEGGGHGEGGGDDVPPPPQPTSRRFYMSTTLDNTRVNRDIDHLMDEVINHLTRVDGARVTLRLEVEAVLPEGASVSTVRTVTENCRTLHVDKFGFED